MVVAPPEPAGWQPAFAPDIAAAIAHNDTPPFVAARKRAVVAVVVAFAATEMSFQLRLATHAGLEEARYVSN